MINKDEFAFALTLALIGALIGMYIGDKAAEERMHKDAVDLGHAEYYVKEDGKKAWRWITERR